MAENEYLKKNAQKGGQPNNAASVQAFKLRDLFKSGVQSVNDFNDDMEFGVDLEAE